MTPDEIQAVARGIAEGIGGAPWTVYLLSAIAAGGASFCGTYFSEKGKNLATREDIGALTEKVEAVKTEYIKQIEDFKAHHQMRMVAAEKRLEAHQQAFLQWRVLDDAMANASMEILYATIQDCHEWYDQNCVYLAPTSRDAYVAMLSSAVEVRNLLQLGKETSDPEIIEGWQTVELARNIFLRDVELPLMNKGQGHSSRT